MSVFACLVAINFPPSLPATFMWESPPGLSDLNHGHVANFKQKRITPALEQSVSLRGFMFLL